MEDLESLSKDRRYWVLKMVLETLLIVRSPITLDNLVILCTNWKRMLQK